MLELNLRHDKKKNSASLPTLENFEEAPELIYCIGVYQDFFCTHRLTAGWAGGSEGILSDPLVQLSSSYDAAKLFTCIMEAS